MTQIEAARKGIITQQMTEVAEDEGLAAEEIRALVSTGEIVIPHNIHHEFRAIGIGKGLRTKVNANIGASNFHQLIEEEVEKLYTAVRYGADSVMDLSTGTDLDKIRAEILSRCSVMIGTVPIYQLGSEGTIMELEAEKFLDVIERQASQGVDYMTLHCGVTRESVKRLRGHPRIEGIVSRGGAMLAAWIERTGNENPLFEHFDEVCAVCREHDVTISMGDGLRPGATGDATDRGQIGELLRDGRIDRARAANGRPGDDRGSRPCAAGSNRSQREAGEARLRGRAVLCARAADLRRRARLRPHHRRDRRSDCRGERNRFPVLCHARRASRLPDIDDVRDGVIATRIAAHSGDLVKGVRGAKVWNDQMSRYRKALNWEGMYAMAMDPDKARRYKEESEASGSNVCSMCGSLCSINIDNAAIKFVKKRSALAEAPKCTPPAETNDYQIIRRRHRGVSTQLTPPTG